MRRIGRALKAFLVGYAVYIVLVEIFIGVMGSITGGYPETLSPFFWPVAAPFLVRPSEWRLVPVFDNVCSLVGGLLILVVAIWVYRRGREFQLTGDHSRNKS
ncbi:MAG: hypothetical protein ABSH39_18595 [Candidatus Acidiferrum sp.]|jgi:hypothetical protein